MMTLFEKLFFLKTVPLFKFVRDDQLLAIAAIIKESRFETGQAIIHQGDWGTDMYLIVNGSVKVHNGDTLVTHLSHHDFFGEISALSPEKRIASVTAQEPTLVLSLNSTQIYALIDEQPDLARGLILALCDRIRSMGSQLHKALHPIDDLRNKKKTAT